MKRRYRFLLPMLAVLALSCGKDGPGQNTYVIPTEVSDVVSGRITWSDGTPVAGVAVSDSYSVTETGADGAFSLKPDKDAYYVWFSIPSDAKVPIGTDGHPCFYRKIQTNGGTYDFVLERQEVENDFIILGLGDPQVKTTSHISRFRSETTPDVNKFIRKHASTPVYGMSLGDMTSNIWDLLDDIRAELTDRKMGIPVFMTIGNHDHEFPKANDLVASRRYESLYGPLNYSFNRGKLHIISMDDVYHGASASDDYVGGLHDWQYKWLQADLAKVPKDWSVLLCNHIAYKDTWTDKSKERYHDEVLNLLGGYADAVMIAGHSHNVNNRFANADNGRKVREFVVGTTCGAWWHGITCTDGAPNGYGVLEYRNSKLANEYYKATRFPENYQMRVYPADEAYYAGGAAWYFDSAVKKANRVVANIWGENLHWQFEVYEDGVLVANKMTKKSTVDPYSASYFVNTEKCTSDSYSSAVVHMFYHDKKNPSAQVKVIAIDPFGNRFECDELTTSVTIPAPGGAAYADRYE